ncbi:MAG: NUDIX hydrolase [Nitrospirae bacterium]|nr:NUDIX hydrolase [Nitrospirota bacterium]
MTRKEIYNGKVVHLSVDEVVLPNGQTTALEMIRHPGASAVVPLKADGRVVLIHQYRYAAGGYIYEIPAGKLTPGEPPETCALREVEEEVGYKVGKLERLTTILTTPGFTDEAIHLFLATDLSPSVQSLDHDEILEVVEWPFEAVMAKIRDGTIRDAKTIVALYLGYEKVTGY